MQYTVLVAGSLQERHKAAEAQNRQEEATRARDLPPRGERSSFPGPEPGTGTGGSPGSVGSGNRARWPSPESHTNTHTQWVGADPTGRDVPEPPQSSAMSPTTKHEHSKEGTLRSEREAGQ